MTGDMSQECRDLCYKIIAEKDPAKMLELVEELNRMLAQRKPASPVETESLEDSA